MMAAWFELEQGSGMRYGDRPSSHVCFDCRRYRSAKHVTCRCPDCKQPMVCMGLSWQPPKRDDIKAWETLRQEALEARDRRTAPSVPFQRWKDVELVERVKAEKKR